jgi:hypothetical protein
MRAIIITQKRFLKNCILLCMSKESKNIKAVLSKTAIEWVIKFG